MKKRRFFAFYAFAVLAVSIQAFGTWTTSGSDQSGGFPTGLTDNNLNTYGMKDKWNQSIYFIYTFPDWKTVKAIKILCADAPGDKPYVITVESADSENGIINESEHFIKLIYREHIASDQFVELPFTMRRAKSFKITVECLTGSKNVRVKEIKFVEIAYPTGTETQDVDVTYIERTPRYNYDAAKNKPAAGDLVTFRAHVRNRGSADLNNVQCKWYIDGVDVSTVNLNVPLSSETLVWNGQIAQPKGIVSEFQWIWETGDHNITFSADTDDAVDEISEENNSVTVMNTSKLVAFVVHQSLLNFFDNEQRNIGIASNSWEDWAQRQITMWNTFMRFNGTAERVCLDYLEVWDDAKYLYGNKPFSTKTMDTQWGLPKDGATNDFYKVQSSGEYTENFNREHSLIHEMSHGLSLIDTYATNFSAYTVENHVITEEYMQIEYGGEQIGGRIYMPMTFWGGIYNVEPSHMGGEYDWGYCPYHTKTMDLYKGQRVKYANANQGGDFYGRYTHRLPHQNYFRILDATGKPLPNAQVMLYNYKVLRWYEVKQYDNLPEFTKTADVNGLLYVGYNIFIDRETSGVLPYDTNGDELITWDEVAFYDTTGDGIIDKDDGSSPADIKTQNYRAIVLKIESDNQVDFHVFEAQRMNLAHYAGQTDSVTYDIKTTIVKGINPANYTNVALNRSVSVYGSHPSASNPNCLVNGQKFDFMSHYVLGNASPSEWWKPQYFWRISYWQVDLGASYEIYKINFYPRWDEYGGNGRYGYQFRFDISNSSAFAGEERLLFYEPNFGASVRSNGMYPMAYAFRPTTGRYVRMQLCNKQPSEWIAMQEVEIFGKAKVYDSDSDSLPDDWEIEFFTNLNEGAAGDYDGDGETNEEEYFAGTNPVDPESVMKIISFEIAGDQATVQWKTMPYEKYVIQYSNGPLGASMTWTPCTERYLGDGNILTYSETLPPDVSQRYYRLQLVNQPWLQ
jgi:hypothetical protein